MFYHHPFSYSFNNVKKKLISDCNAAWLIDKDSESVITTFTGNGQESGKESVLDETLITENTETGNEKNGKGSAHSSIRSTGFVLLPHQISTDSSVRVNMK